MWKPASVILPWLMSSLPPCSRGPNTTAEESCRSSGASKNLSNVADFYPAVTLYGIAQARMWFPPPRPAIRRGVGNRCHPSSSPGRAEFLLISTRHASPARSEHELFWCGEVTCICLTEREHTHALSLTEILQ